MDLIYLLTPGHWSGFEAALLSMARRFMGRVRVIRGGREESGWLTRLGVFISKSVPNVIVFRNEEILEGTIKSAARG